jgi:hypothetical protein
MLPVLWPPNDSVYHDPTSTPNLDHMTFDLEGDLDLGGDLDLEGDLDLLGDLGGDLDLLTSI